MTLCVYDAVIHEGVSYRVRERIMRASTVVEMVEVQLGDPNYRRGGGFEDFFFSILGEFYFTRFYSNGNTHTLPFKSLVSKKCF